MSSQLDRVRFPVEVPRDPSSPSQAVSPAIRPQIPAVNGSNTSPQRTIPRTSPLPPSGTFSETFQAQLATELIQRKLETVYERGAIDPRGEPIEETEETIEPPRGCLVRSESAFDIARLAMDIALSARATGIGEPEILGLKKGGILDQIRTEVLRRCLPNGPVKRRLKLVRSRN